MPQAKKTKAKSDSSKPKKEQPNFSKSEMKQGVKSIINLIQGTLNLNTKDCLSEFKSFLPNFINGNAVYHSLTVGTEKMLLRITIKRPKEQCDISLHCNLKIPPSRGLVEFESEWRFDKEGLKLLLEGINQGLSK